MFSAHEREDIDQPRRLGETDTVAKSASRSSDISAAGVEVEPEPTRLFQSDPSKQPSSQEYSASAAVTSTKQYPKNGLISIVPSWLPSARKVRRCKLSSTRQAGSGEKLRPIEVPINKQRLRIARDEVEQIAAKRRRQLAGRVGNFPGQIFLLRALPRPPVRRKCGIPRRSCRPGFVSWFWSFSWLSVRPCAALIT